MINKTRERPTKEDLSQMLMLKHEIRLLDDQLSRLKEKRLEMNGSVLTDSVRGSMSCEPFVIHNIPVVGLSENDVAVKTAIRDQITDLKIQLSKRRDECDKEYIRLNRFISTVDDSEMRQILTLKYIYGKSFQQIANRLGYCDEGTPRKKHDKFLKHSENSE